MSYFNVAECAYASHFDLVEIVNAIFKLKKSYRWGMFPSDPK